MKKTSHHPSRRLPVSQKAYKSFRERILKVNDIFAVDPHYMLWLFEEYMEGRTHDKSGGGLACDLAFEMLRIDIDAAIARSARARESARLRRERRERQNNFTQSDQEDTLPVDQEREVAAKITEDLTCSREKIRKMEAAKRMPPSIIGSINEFAEPTSSARGMRCASDT